MSAASRALLACVAGVSVPLGVIFLVRLVWWVAGATYGAAGQYAAITFGGAAAFIGIATGIHVFNSTR